MLVDPSGTELPMNRNHRADGVTREVYVVQQRPLDISLSDPSAFGRGGATAHPWRVAREGPLDLRRVVTAVKAATGLNQLLAHRLGGAELGVTGEMIRRRAVAEGRAWGDLRFG
jgi:hypothetical protein